MPRVNTKDTLPGRPTPAPWTSSRCNRTLRAVTSFANRLEKWHQAYLAAEKEEELDNGAAERADKAVAQEPQPDWLAANGAGRKHKGKKTYLMRRRKLESTKPSLKPPTALSLTANTPTKTVPVIPDEAGLDSSSSGQDNSLAPTGRMFKKKDPSSGTNHETSGTAVWSHKWTQRTAHLAREYAHIIQTTSSTVSAFLVATSDPQCSNSRPGLETAVDVQEPPRQGTRSLVDLCLRTLSKEMVQEQKQCDAHNDGFNGQVDAIGSRLEELEEYFGDAKFGWPQLRSVTRLCGIHMIANLTETGVLPEPVAMDLALRSYSHPALSDLGPDLCRALVNKHLNSSNPDAGYHDLPHSYKSLATVTLEASIRHEMSVRWTLLALQRRHGSVAIISRFIRFNHLFHLTIVWRVCNRWQVPGCPSALLEAIYVGALATGRADCELYQNGRGVLIKASLTHTKELTEHHTMSEAVGNRLQMGFTLLLCMAHGERMVDGVGLLIERISKRAQILYELDQDYALTEYQLYLIAHIFFANMCLLLLNKHEPPHDLLYSFESLLQTIEACASKSWHPLRSVFVMTLIDQPLNSAKFQDVVRRLMGLEYRNCETLEVLLAMVGADAAMDYAAEHHDNASVLRWATEVYNTSQAKMERRVTEPRTPGGRQPKAGYRWDEAIEEWIARTPATLAKLKKKGAGATTDEVPVAETTSSTKGPDAPAADYRKACRSTVADDKQEQPSMKRKCAAFDVEAYRDGDFEYKKKPKRHANDYGNIEKSGRHGSRYRDAIDDESEDELSLII